MKMYIKQIILFVFMLFSVVTFSQSGKTISGQLICKDAVLQGITILNLVTEKETISDFNGRFSIIAKIDELLVIQSANFEYARKIIDEDDFKNGTISINLIKKIEQLEEVKIVNYNNINAVDLGILQTAAKTYTPAERKLRTATGKFPETDILINAISGRTKMLKRYVAYEKIEIQSNKLSDMFMDEYFIKNLQIPEDKIKAFQNYAAEYESIIEPLRQRNKFLVSYALVPLAKQYIDLQNIKTE